MTARAIGDVLSGREFTKSRRSGEKVWRNSYYEGQIEHRLWRPIGDGTKRGGKRRAGAILKAARQFEYRTRVKRRIEQPGCENGLLGAIGLEVLEALYEVVDFASGRLEPAIATIGERIGRSYAAVHRALCRLREAGFLHWARRSRKLDNAGDAGPQVEQITNAYALLVPKELEFFLSRLIGRGPKPDCDRWRREDDAAEWQRMLDGLTARELHDATWNGDQLVGETIARIADALDERESIRVRETGGV